MANDVLKLPGLGWEIPKPKTWDFAAVGIALVGLISCGANIAASGLMTPGATVSTPLTIVFVLVALAVCGASLLVLGKTAKEGTIHGNLFAVAGMFIGLGGSMLAAALWALA